MKTAGIIIFTIDLIKTLYTGLTNVSSENVAAMEKLERKADKHGTINWQPYIGIGMMVIGSAFLVLGKQKSMSN